MIAYLRSLRLFNRNIRLYLVSSLIIGFSYMGIFLVLFNLYLLRLGYGPQFIGALSATGPLAFILASIPAGRLGRRFGIRRMIMAGIVLYLIGFGLIPFAEFVPPQWQALWLYATYIIAFLGGPLYWVNSTIYLMAMTGNRAERNHVFSFRIALISLAGFIGGLTAGFLASRIALLLDLSLSDPAPYRYALWLGASLYIIPFLAMLRAANVEGEAQSKISPSWRMSPLAIIVPLVCVEILRIAGEIGVQTFYNVYLDSALSLSPVGISIIVSTASLLAGITTLGMPTLAGRWGEGRIVFLSMLGMALLLIPLALVPHWIVAAICFVIFRALNNISRAVSLVYRMELVVPLWWTTMSAASVTGEGIGQSVVLLGGGVLIEAAGFTPFFLAMGAVIFIGAILFRIFYRAQSHKTSSGLAS